MSLDSVEVATAHKVRMSDLARLAGVSVATVSRSLSDSPLINRVTKSRVWQVACDHGYSVGHDMPETLREARRTVAVFVPFGSDNTADHQAITFGLIEAARDLNCNLLFSHLGPHDHHDLSAVLAHKEADAFIFLGADGLDMQLNRLCGQHRLVVWGEAGHTARYNCAGPDNFAGGREATTHLAAQGCQRIAYVGDIDGPGLQQRFMGYLTALNDAGLRFDPALVLRELPANMPEEVMDGLFIAEDKPGDTLWRALAKALPVAAWSPSLRLSRQGLAAVTMDQAAAGRDLLGRLLRAQAEPGQTVIRVAVQLAF